MVNFKGNLPYSYTLTSYDENGKEKEITFGTSKELQVGVFISQEVVRRQRNHQSHTSAAQRSIPGDIITSISNHSQAGRYGIKIGGFPGLTVPAVVQTAVQMSFNCLCLYIAVLPIIAVGKIVVALFLITCSARKEKVHTEPS